MKNKSIEEPKVYFERNTIVILVMACLAIAADYFGYTILIQPNPWGIFMAIFGLVLTIQTLWLILNPYTIVYDDKFEIKQSFFLNKEYFFLDIKSIELNHQKMIITYNDLEKDALPLFGMRPSHKQKMFEHLKKHIDLNMIGRDF